MGEKFFLIAILFLLFISVAFATTAYSGAVCCSNSSGSACYVPKVGTGKTLSCPTYYSSSGADSWIGAAFSGPSSYSCFAPTNYGFANVSYYSAGTTNYNGQSTWCYPCEFCSSVVNGVCGNGSNGCSIGTRIQSRSGCPSGSSCPGQCIVDSSCNCTNVCSLVATQCNGSNVQSCITNTSTGCTEWDSGTLCSYGCVNGACNSAPTNFSLQTIVNPSNAGTISNSSLGINCGNNCSYSINFGTLINVTASPATGYLFSSWNLSNGACLNGNTVSPCVLTIDSAKILTANFVSSAACANRATQSCVALNGCNGTQSCSNGSWGVCSTTLKKCGDNSCGASCPADDAVCNYVTIDGNNWESISKLNSGQRYSFEVSFTNTGSNSWNEKYALNSYRQMILPTGVKSYKFPLSLGSSVFQGNRTEFNFFIDTENVETADSYTFFFQMNRLISGTWNGVDINTFGGFCKKIFNVVNQRKLVVSKQKTIDFAGNGTVKSIPVGINCGLDCESQEKQFVTKITINLTATPDANSIFAGWGGACAGEKTNNCIIDLNSDKNVLVFFVKKEKSCNTVACPATITSSFDINSDYIPSVINKEDYSNSHADINGTSHIVATIKDILTCTSTLQFASTVKTLPDNYVLTFYFYDTNVLPLNYQLNIKKDCKWDANTNTATCKKQQAILQTEAGSFSWCQTRLDMKTTSSYSKLAESSNSNEIGIAKYVFYFVPVNSDYGSINAQYDYFVGLSQINDNVNLLGKKILLLPQTIDQNKICCDLGSNNFFSISNNYFWRSPQDCKTEKIVYSSNCNSDNEDSFYALFFDKIKKLVWEKLPKTAIPLPNSNKLSFTVILDGSLMQKYHGDKKGAFYYNSFKLVYVSNTSNKTTLAHEFGHSIGALCDEYNIVSWAKQNKFTFLDCKQQVGESKTGETSTGQFPKCCVSDSICNAYGATCQKTSLGKEKVIPFIDSDLCYPLGSEFNCYKPECFDDSECTKKGSCFCENNKCVSCASGSSCVSASSKNMCSFLNSYITSCSGTDTNCFVSKQEGVCIDCTVFGKVCDKKNSVCVYPDAVKQAFSEKCGVLSSCKGMPYDNETKSSPKDISVPSPFVYHSIMGIDILPEDVYPKKSVCPLRNC